MTESPQSAHSFGDPNSPGRFQWDQTDEERVVRVLGEVDLSNARDVMRSLDELGDRHLIVDLTEVEFMDSTGLGVLVELQTQTPNDLGLVVTAGSQVDRLLDLTGLKTFFAIDHV